MIIKGYIGAILELFGFYIISKNVKDNYKIHIYNDITYYWLCFTILTGFWELFYILKYKIVVNYSKYLILKKKHVWFDNYNINMILPWNLSKIFYSEYAAYADREYMSKKDDWSRFIEGTHLFICAYFSFLTIFFYTKNKYKHFYISLGIAMGSQFMNSILYMAQYFIQTNNKNNVNYNSYKFPTGFLLSKRPFMLINIFWVLMPYYILYIHLQNYNLYKKLYFI